MIDPTLIALEADQKHQLVVTPERAEEIAHECDALLSALRPLRPMLAFDDSFINFQRSLLETAASVSKTNP